LPAIANWDNETGLKAAASSAWGWGRAFCQSHHVGAFCHGYTRVRCCRSIFGYVNCGSSVNANTCGWHSGYGSGVWNIQNEDASADASPDETIGQNDAGPDQEEPNAHQDANPLPATSSWFESSTAVPSTEESHADVFADETTGYDEVGPFMEEPSAHQDANPLLAIADWDNETVLKAAAFNSWGRSFCESHRVGAFCDGYTRVRCCRNTFGYVKCGTTAHASTCGWRGGGSGYGGGGYSGGVWTIHPGWRQSSFCRSHHVGFFCYSHHKVHCCNDHGHFVECTTSRESHWRC